MIDDWIAEQLVSIEASDKFLALGKKIILDANAVLEPHGLRLPEQWWWPDELKATP